MGPRTEFWDSRNAWAKVAQKQPRLCAAAIKAASPSSILRRVAYPVEPFNLKLLLRMLLPPSLKGDREGFWQQPRLFEQVKEHPADEFK